MVGVVSIGQDTSQLQLQLEVFPNIYFDGIFLPALCLSDVVCFRIEFLKKLISFSIGCLMKKNMTLLDCLTV